MSRSIAKLTCASSMTIMPFNSQGTVQQLSVYVTSLATSSPLIQRHFIKSIISAGGNKNNIFNFKLSYCPRSNNHIMFVKNKCNSA